MRIPDPKANTTTEAYLAYKAGYLEESELKPVLYEPYPHFDGWLAYWAGLVNTYPTKENGDPEMLCDEEALVAYLSGVTDTYPEEIKDPYDVRIVGYLRHLASIRWPEPDYPVNNEEFYLSTMEPTHTSNPVPSSDIELDTVEGKIISVEAYGDTYQQTYSGKNLFNKSMAPTISGGGANTVTETATGVRITVDTAGTYSFRGWIVGKVSDYLNKTLTLSANVSKSADGVRPNMYIGYCNDVGGARKTVGIVAGVGEKSCSAQISEVDAEGREYIIVALYGTEGTTAPIGDYSQYDDVQLQIGEATAYEPYTGGIPAPNPDYPQAVQVVTGKQMVKMNGKNLINIPNFTSSQHGITAEGSNQTIELTGTAGNTYFPDFRFYKDGAYASREYRSTVNQIDASKGFFTEPNSEYKLSIFVEGDTPYAIVEGFETKVTNNLGLVGNQVITINDSERLNFVSISISQNVQADIKVRFQLEKGSDTAYEPYQSQSYEINLGKNLFDCPSTANTTPNTVFTKIDSNSFRTDFTKTTTTLQSSFTQIQLLGLLPNTTYTISCSSEVTGDNYNRAGQFRMHIGSNWSNYYSGSATFTTPSDVSSVYFAPANAQDITEPGSNSVVFSNVQLELGSTASPYAPYFTPIELCKIGDYQDYIYKSGDDWYVHKACGLRTFSSSSGWTYGGKRDKYYGFYIGMQGMNVGVDKPGLSNYFLQSKYTSSPTQTCFMINSTGTVNNLIIYSTTITTTTEMNTLFGNEPMNFYYPLATPTDTKITDATLVGQLEALAGADAYDGKTFIKVTTADPDLPALLKVEAYKY